MNWPLLVAEGIVFLWQKQSDWPLYKCSHAEIEQCEYFSSLVMSFTYYLEIFIKIKC